MKDRGFWATLIGGVIGGGIGLVLGATIGWAVAPEGDGFEGLEIVFAMAVLVSWLCAVLAAYIALRAISDPEASSTARWLAILTLPLVGGAAWLAVSLTDADDFGSNFIPYLIFVTSVLATPYLARRLGTATASPES